MAIADHKTMQMTFPSREWLGSRPVNAVDFYHAPDEVVWDSDTENEILDWEKRWDRDCQTYSFEESSITRYWFSSPTAACAFVLKWAGTWKRVEGAWLSA